MTKFRGSLSCGVALGAFLAADGALAQTVVTVGHDEVLGNVTINDDGTVTNDGTILGDVFILDDGTVTNTGTIGGSVLILNGFPPLKSHTITNSGTIGGDVLIEGGTITNTGTIVGIVQQTGFGTITNSGSLGGALLFVPGTLNLLAGSVVHGGIYFINPGSTLNIGHGQNTALILTGPVSAINSFGAPMTVQGSVVAVVDPTGFSAQDEMLTDLTRAIANAVDGRINAGRFGYAPPATPLLSFAEAGGGADAQAMAFGYPMGSTGAASSGHGFWATGIGAWRDQDGDGANGAFDTGLGGLLVGLDGEMANGMRMGAFLGASASRFETDANSQEIDADSYFGGIYGSYSAQTYFLDMSLTGGVTSQSSDRSVANNLVIGGIEHAKADYDGVFVSPSATIGTTYSMGEAALIPTFRARYAGLFLDGYEEHGSAADMTVDDRDVNVFDFRAQLAYALAARPLNGGVLHTALRFGADATFADQDDVQAVLLGTGLNFSVSGDDTLRGFAGLDLSWRAAGGADLFLGAEAGYDSGDAFTLDVLGGLRIPL